MIDRDHAEGRPGILRKLHPHRGLGEARPGIVDPHRVVRAAGVAADVADDAEFPPALPARGFELRFGDERRDRLIAEVDAVDEDVGFDDLGEGAATRGFGHVPFYDVRGRDAGVFAEVHGAVTAAAKGADYENSWWGGGKGQGGGEGGLEGGD